MKTFRPPAFGPSKILGDGLKAAGMKDNDLHLGLVWGFLFFSDMAGMLEELYALEPKDGPFQCFFFGI